MRNIKVNDIVYLKSSHTMKKGYEGPYQVLQITSPVNVKIQRFGEPNAPILKVHLNRLWIATIRRTHLQDEGNWCHPCNYDHQQNQATSSDATQISNSNSATHIQNHPVDCNNSSTHGNDCQSEKSLTEQQGFSENNEPNCDTSYDCCNESNYNSSSFGSSDSSCISVNEMPCLTPHIDEGYQNATCEFFSPPVISGPF